MTRTFAEIELDEAASLRWEMGLPAEQRILDMEKD